MRNSLAPKSDSSFPALQPTPTNGRNPGPERGRGSSVVEVFVALLLLALGLLLLPMLKMTTLLATNTSNPSRTLVALDMAQDAIDRFEQMPWDALRSSSAEGFDEERDIVEPVFSRLPQAAGDSTTVDGVEYHRLWRVVTDPEVPRLKTVTVWCCWRPDGTRWRHVTLLTQIADRAR